MEWILNIDNSILDFIQNNMRNLILDRLMPIITKLGNGGVIWVVISLILISIRKYRKYGYIILGSLLLCMIVGNITLKNLVARIRPFNANDKLSLLLIAAPRDFSFPSGHTMCAFASATVICYMNKKTGILAVILSILIGFSRLYLYVHYPSDVFVGMIIGILLGYISIMIYKYIVKNNIKFIKKN